MLRAWMLAALVLAVATFFDAVAQPVESPSRGQLLYATHCIACHSDQVHWRAKKLVSDWASLKGQVRRWQSVQALGWSDEDITDVASYLNFLYYRFPTPG